MVNLSSLILISGLWRAVLMTPGGELPFQMLIEKADTSYTLTIINSDERILIDNVILKEDSLIATFPVYESELRLRINSPNELQGYFVNLTRSGNNKIPMKAYAGDAPRFYPKSKEPAATVDGRWSVMFSPGTADSSFAIGVFEQDGFQVKGTFLTTSGDYRYLEGIVDKDSLFLSTFDGVFVYLFKARVSKNTIDGMFYSGIYSQKPWSGFRDESAKLPDATKITSYDDSEKKFSFSFADVDSNMVSLNDSMFENKVVVVQFLGSWCPNCLDESKFLESYYKENKHKGFEIVGLSFEKTDDFSRASSNIMRFTKRLGISYPVLIASNRNKLTTVYPELKNFHAYPTTIFLDKSHKIRKIHAGFSGQATGVEFLQFKREFDTIMGELLAE